MTALRLFVVTGLGYAFDPMAAVVVERLPLTISTFALLGEFLVAELPCHARWADPRCSRASETTGIHIVHCPVGA